MEVSAEAHFARTLASNDKKFRDKALKRLRKYISVRSCHGEGLNHEDHLKIWKGLHYCMWMQDKPLIQEELSQNMAQLLQAFSRLEDALRFVKVFFITEAREWNGIDRLRLDKFMMLMRDILHESFALLSREGWPSSHCQTFAQNLTSAVMTEDSAKMPLGVKTHLADIYVIELRKVSLDGMTGKKLTTLMFPFLYFLLKTKRRESVKAVFDKTISTVLSQFGSWPWQGQVEGEEAKGVKSRSVKKGQGQEEEEDSDYEEDDSDNDEGMGSDDDEHDDDESDEEEEEADMEVDDDNGGYKRIKLNLSTLLKLMQLLAEDPKVESKNRSYIYGIVNNYVKRDPSILNRSQNGSKDDDNASDDDGDDVKEITSVFQLTGEEEKVEGNNRRKRKRKGRKEREQEEGKGMDRKGHSTETNGDIINHNVNHAGLNQPKSATTTNGLQNNKTNKTSPVGKKDKDSGNKKNNKKRKLEENDDDDDGVDDMEQQENISPQNQSPKHKNNNKKNNLVGGKNGEKEGGSDKDWQEKDTTVTSELVKKSKKRKRESVDQEIDFKRMKFENNSVAATKPSSPGNTNNNNKKKKTPTKETLNLTNSITTTAAAADTASTTPTTKKNKNNNSNNTDDDDLNTNAKKIPSSSSSPVTKKNVATTPTTTPVQLKVYKQKSPTIKPTTAKQLAKSLTTPVSSTTAFTVSDSSSPSRKKGSSSSSSEIPSPSPSALASNSSSSPMSIENGDGTKGGKKGKKSKKSLSPSACGTEKVEALGVMSSLYNAMSSPCNMIKKAVGMVAPAPSVADPDGGSKEMNAATPEQCSTPGSSTPGSQKKVIFNLRKNKANKFQDYLKSLASDPPSPAFEPTKSPGQGILKTPSNESCASSLDSSASINTTPNTRRKKGSKGSATKRKSASPVLRGIF